MRRLLLIANPAASGFTGGLFRTITALLADSYQIEPAWPVSPDAARRAAKAAAAEGCDVVVAFGGDGVVHHVANGLAGSDTALGIIPAGTTNVLARLIGIPNRPRKAADLLVGEPHTITAPLARLQIDDSPTVSYATFGAGVGYDASVVELSDAQPYRKYWFGSVHYARSAARSLLGDYRSRKPQLRVSDGARQLDAVTVLAQVHSRYTYFGKVPLGARVEDDLTVVVFERIPLRRAPSILMRAIRDGAMDKVKGVHVWRNIEEFTVIAEPEEAIQADGELLGRAGRVTISSAPDALKVVVPGPEDSDA